MSSIVTYKGYRAEVYLDTEDDILVGHLLGIKDSVWFHGTTIPEMYESFHNAVDNHLDWCREEGIDPETRRTAEVLVN